MYVYIYIYIYIYIRIHIYIHTRMYEHVSVCMYVATLIWRLQKQGEGGRRAGPPSEPRPDVRSRRSSRRLCLTIHRTVCYHVVTASDAIVIVAGDVR